MKDKLTACYMNVGVKTKMYLIGLLSLSSTKITLNLFNVRY